MDMTRTCIPDTDSIKCLLPPEELEQFCEIDDVRLGAWKNERNSSKTENL